MMCVLVAQSCPTLCNPMDWSLPGSSVHGTLQARLSEWVAMPFSKGSSWPRDWIQVSCISGRFFTIWAPREAQLMILTCIYIKTFCIQIGVPTLLSGKEFACLCRRRRFDSSVGKILWSRKREPLQYSCLESFMDRGACLAAFHGVTKSWTRLSMHTYSLGTYNSFT